LRRGRGLVGASVGGCDLALGVRRAPWALGARYYVQRVPRRQNRLSRRGWLVPQGPYNRASQL
jgi:hypothetical protein